MLKIVLLGYGAMGRTIDACVAELSDVKVVARVDSYALGCVTCLDQVTEDFDVVVDFSKPESLKNTLDYCERTKKPAVLATTGYTIDQVERIRALSKTVPLFYTQNMSMGVNVLERILTIMAPMLKENFDIEIIEKHHNKKVDAPSGTAKMLLRAVMGNDTQNVVYGREGNAPRQKGEIGVHAIRGGTIPGEHTVIFAGQDEIIEIKHTALSKGVFAQGAIKAARFLQTAAPGLYQMNDVL